MNYIENLKNNSALSFFLHFAKKHFYNRYVSRNLSAFDFPQEIWIENTNVCNAVCVMCPREKQSRPLGLMKFSLFEKLIKEISGFSDSVNRVHLHNYGEPLMDKELPKRIKLAKEFGIKHVFFVTNASLLTQELSREIIVAGLD